MLTDKEKNDIANTLDENIIKSKEDYTYKAEQIKDVLDYIVEYLNFKYNKDDFSQKIQFIIKNNKLMRNYYYALDVWTPVLSLYISSYVRVNCQIKHDIIVEIYKYIDNPYNAPVTYQKSLIDFDNFPEAKDRFLSQIAYLILKDFKNY